MAKAQSPLLGYNTNVRHKGKVFHIQTEDSGLSRPHVMTHLFADGGRVLKTQKTSYAELVNAPDVSVLVKKLMQDQHKAMFVALRDGHFDAQLEVGDAAPAEAPPAKSGPAPVAPETPPVMVEAPPLMAEGPPVEAPPLVPEARPAVPEALPVVPEAPPVVPEAPPVVPEAPPVVPEELPEELLELAIEVDDASLEVEALEPRATIPPTLEDLKPVPAPVGAPSPSMKQSGPWTAPLPRSSLKPIAETPPPASAATPPPPAIAAPRAVPAAKGFVAPRRPSTGSVPIARSATPPPRQGPGFGERLVSERSLDEVILAYLAEELEDSRAR